MPTFLDWFWRNNYLIGLLAMEASLCAAFPRKEKALVKWVVCTLVMLIISTVAMQAWEWEGPTIAVENIVSNVLCCTLIAAL